MSMTALVVASLDVVFGPLFSLPPVLSVVVFAAILSVVSIVFNKLLMDKEFVKDMKAKTTELNKRIKNAQREGNKEVLSSSMKEMMELNGKYMKESMRVMIATLMVAGLIFFYLSTKYSGVTVDLPFSIPLVGSSVNWIYWYIIISLTISLVLRKITGVK